LPTPKLFVPDDALHFRHLPEQYRNIQDMRRMYDRFREHGYSSKQAFYFAFVRGNPNQHEVATAVGEDEFLRRVTEYLREAQNMVEHVIDRYLRPFAGRLDPHNAVANCLDPIAMLKMATDDLPQGASALDRRLRLEALRQLAIALQLFAIESADDEAWVADDLSSIDRLSWKRLFLPNTSQELWVLIEQHTEPTLLGSAKTVEVFTRARDKAQRVRSLIRAKLPFKEEHFACRVVFMENRRFYIYAISRRKRLPSTLLKLERGRKGTDRRGWKYVVVATQTAEGMLTTATVEDADAFHQLTKQALWQDPLFEEQDVSPPNPDSDQRYKDLKTIGRFHRPDNGRIIAGNAEQLVTTITRYADTLFARNGVNHYLYRARQILKHIAPLWFPHSHKPFKGVRGLKLPDYSVDWSKEFFCRQLEVWWLTQI
jgi:hypothetical protein